ncbi:phage Gp37/Gp68 family protein [Burkholderia cepacia]|uniref:phage Gp37/Gp68 family protein n=1 Tax=Burkholderia cepacia TaxID=292 RepID=UPI001CF499E7|nr:phage Gp37/Gp68 family protein [Burkholderia cepacia]MCA8328909.1 phage Gp37/Gp68 family protein [Burkholderia cepacia]
MSENSKIEWTDSTFNPWEGCQKVGAGCDHCYAESRNARFAGGTPINWGPGAPRRRTSAANWRKPLAWNAAHADFFAEHGRRQRVFCASLADVFDNAVPDAWRADLFDLIWNTPHLDWLLLTKRIGNARPMISRALELAGRGVNTPWPWSNVWIGATIVNQEEADRDIPKLFTVPAHVRLLSMEPLLGPVDISRHLDYCEKLDKHGISRRVGGQHIKCDEHCGISWVIVGGESGPGARPMHPDWARSLRDQCAAAGVPFLFKQHGEWAPGSGDFGAGRIETAAIALDGRVAVGGYRVDDYPRGATSGDGWSMVHRAGKRTAGRLLDGRTHDEFPEVIR